MKQSNYFTNKYFSEDELTGGGKNPLVLHPGFLAELYALRVIFNRPMIVNSCCRSPEYNKKIGGHVNSLHLTENPKHPTEGTMAIDISAKSLTIQSDLVQKAIKYGWSVGIADTFIHLDRRVDIGLPQYKWHY